MAFSTVMVKHSWRALKVTLVLKDSAGQVETKIIMNTIMICELNIYRKLLNLKIMIKV